MNDQAGHKQGWPRRHWVHRAALSPIEYMRQRRARRLERNTSASEKARVWAEQNGFTLHVYSEGQHWIWQKGPLIAEWWPSSARLVFNREYHHWVHAHDWKLVVLHLSQRSARRPAVDHEGRPPAQAPRAPLLE